MQKKRVYAVFAAAVVLFCGVGVRLFSLSDDSLRAASNQQSTRRQTIAVSRGTIYDRYLQPLVNTETEIIASLAPFEECIAAVRKGLSGGEAAAILSLFETEERPVTILSRWLPPTLGVAQVEAPVRYGEPMLAPHIIGYVNGENRGVTGVESGYEDILASFAGEATVSYAIDALGNPMSSVDDVVKNTLDYASGGVALTLDAQVQSIVQSAAESTLSRGAVIVTDASSAQVLAAVSLPLYDPDCVADVLYDASSPLLDRTRINYNCGSVFKIITAAAALEKGISPDTVYTCTGSVTVDGVCFSCHNQEGDGPLSMREAMACSCNSYFIQLALDVGASAIERMANKAGWDTSLTVCTGNTTAIPILPDREDLSANAALANFAIGQGDLLATPYHVHALAQAVANGGLRKEATLYYGRVDENGTLTPTGHQPETTRLFSEATAAVLGDMLTAVVNEGTGVSALPKAGQAAGKTGTAETGWMQNGAEVVQSWFTGYYPAETPQYVITVLSENGGANGQTAAPLFATIINELAAAGLVM